MGRAVTSTPRTTIARLSEEVQRFTELGFTHAKIKIGSVACRRIRSALRRRPSNCAAALRTSP